MSDIYDERVVAGSYMERTIGDHVRGCEVAIESELERANPDNTVIALLCDSVRMAREYCRVATGKIR